MKKSILLGLFCFVSFCHKMNPFIPMQNVATTSKPSQVLAFAIQQIRKSPMRPQMNKTRCKFMKLCVMFLFSLVTNSRHLKPQSISNFFKMSTLFLGLCLPSKRALWNTTLTLSSKLLQISCWVLSLMQVIELRIKSFWANEGIHMVALQDGGSLRELWCNILAFPRTLLPCYQYWKWKIVCKNIYSVVSG